ncbi:MAG: hypothetical protein J07HR59_01124, partial [Halorubrum sp. J07HR59]
MATDTQGQRPTGESVFEKVSRIRGVVFEYVTLGASVFGIVSLAVLLGYVFWDAFGLQTAAPAWYGILLVTLVAPVAGFLLYARRNPTAGRTALELVSTTVGGVLGAVSLVVVVDIIAGAQLWFTYFVTTVVPLVGLYLYGRQVESQWIGLA